MSMGLVLIGVITSFAASPASAVAADARPGWRVEWERRRVNCWVVLNHPSATRAYAWCYRNDEGEARYVAVLGVPPINTALDAVRAYIAAQAQKRQA